MYLRSRMVRLFYEDEIRSVEGLDAGRGGPERLGCRHSTVTILVTRISPRRADRQYGDKENSDSPKES
jgi:hypothetical protein